MPWIPRFTEPEASRRGPSHSPPDVRYAPGIGLARSLGWFGIGLGLAEMLAPRRMADAIGVRDERLLPLFGLREIMSGVAILASDRPTAGMWSRVAGDMMDLAYLGSALASSGTRKERVALAAAAVAGVTALDVISCTQQTAAAALEG